MTHAIPRGRLRCAQLALEAMLRRRDRLRRRRQGDLADALERLGPPARLGRQVRRANHGLFSGAADRLARRLFPTLRLLVEDLSPLVRDPNLEPRAPSLRELVEELGQLEEEAEAVAYEPRAGLVLARTPPVELEGLWLGPFELRLDVGALDRLDERRPYRVEALDPRPAAGHEEVTHPHVSSDRLCEGDATWAVTRALESGRFAELYLLVHRVLLTYNAHSPFVPLDEWDREPCPDCGDRAELSTCDHCGDPACDGCSAWCTQTQTVVCLSCAVVCGHDGHRYHPDAIGACRACGADVCTRHLDDRGLCPACAEEADEEEPTPLSEGEPHEDETPALNPMAGPAGA